MAGKDGKKWQHFIGGIIVSIVFVCS